MATTRTIVVLLALIVPQHVASLQVTPNSPCASVCIDSDGLDKSDPSSSNTRSSDITCKDADYSRTTAGIKWQNCMTCLQTSSYFQGNESDQGWFLYNVRYNFNYCVYGYPNNTKIGSNPCQTSRACGALNTALITGQIDPTVAGGDFGYCTADSSAMTGEFYAKCLTCISSFTDQVYVMNGLVALEAGCEQRPALGAVLGLNDTIFSPSLIGIVSPDSLKENSHAEGGSSTTTTTIAASVIGGVLVIAAVASVIFLCVRKRRNRRARALAAGGGWPMEGNGGSADGFPSGYPPNSPLSFRCQTSYLGPAGGVAGEDKYSSIDDEAPAYQQQQQRRHITSMYRTGAPNPSLWRPNNAISSLSPVDDYKQKYWPSSPEHHQEQQQQHPMEPYKPLSEKAALHQLTTTSLPPARPPATSLMSSPQSASPTSATQLLPPGGGRGGGAHAAYVPADYAGALPLRAPAPTTGDNNNPRHQSSPQQQWGWPAPVVAPSPSPTPPPPPSKSPRLGLVFNKRKASQDQGSPVESTEIKTSFSAPPKR